MSTHTNLRRETSYSPLPPHTTGTEALYSTSAKSPLSKAPPHTANNDYYYHKEHELNSRKHDEVDSQLTSPRQQPLHESSSSSLLSKNYSSEKYVTESQARQASPVVVRHSSSSPLTVTTTRYETSTSRNVRSSSPAPRRDSASPAAGGGSSHYITQSAHRVASPQTLYNRLASPSPIQLHQLRVSSPAPLSPTANGATSYKVTEETSTYKRTNNVTKTTSDPNSPSYYAAKPLGGYGM